jgi:hypothetical protein
MMIILRPHNSKDTKRWRNRAAKMRTLAGTMADPNAAVLLTDLAAHDDSWPKRRQSVPPTPGRAYEQFPAAPRPLDPRPQHRVS